MTAGFKGYPRANAFGAMRTTLNHAEDVVTPATREHERRADVDGRRESSWSVNGRKGLVRWSLVVSKRVDFAHQEPLIVGKPFFATLSHAIY